MTDTKTGHSPGHRQPTVEQVNHASFRIANLVYDLASQFPSRESYRPLEELAQRIQHEIVTIGCEALKADRERREREGILRQLRGDGEDGAG